MTTANRNPHGLYLAGRESPDWAEIRPGPADRCPRRLDAFDPRWVMAVRVYEELERSGSAKITENGRERLLARGASMTLGQFETLAIIAIVAGEAAAGRDALGHHVEAKLVNVTAPAETAPKSDGLTVNLAIAVFATVAAMACLAAAVFM